MARKYVMTLLKAVSGAVIMLGLSACASIKLPKLDVLKLPEFKEESENIGDFPDVEEVPNFPNEVKSSQAWDDQANEILSIRDNFITPAEAERPKTEDQIYQEIDRLTESVKEYRKDDPPQ